MSIQSRQNWEQVCGDTLIRMREHLIPFMAPVSLVHSELEGEHLGTGTYVEHEGSKFLITNEHVARHLKEQPLAHQFHDCEEVFKLTNQAIAIPAPIDVAVSRIADSTWSTSRHKAIAIPGNRFAGKHNPAEKELLFFSGYSGEKSKFLFGQLLSHCTPYLTQECSFPSDVNGADIKFHFALHYNPELAKSVAGNSHLPDPHGFSGSLVWNTMSPTM